MLRKVCQFCNKTFLVHFYRGKTSHFCSNDCYYAYRKENAYRPKICPFCKVEFLPNRNTRFNKYCLLECSILGRRKYKTKEEKIRWADEKKTKISKWRGEKKCPHCKKIFEYTSKGIHQIFCSVDCQIKSRAYRVNERFFNEIDTEAKAYLLGFIFADGSVAQNRNLVNISSGDKEVIEMAQELLETNMPIHKYKSIFCLNLTNSKLRQSLIKHGVLPRKSWKDYGLPKIPRQLLPHFIRGVFDGDGSFYLDRRKKYEYLGSSFCSNSKRFLKEIKATLNNAGIRTQNLYLDQKPNGWSSWQLRISAKDEVRKLVDYLYENANHYLNRKHRVAEAFYNQRGLLI